MLCHPSFSLPATFSEAVNAVNAATDAAAARLDTLPSALGDTVFDVDRAVHAAIGDINTVWVHALTLQDTFHSGIVDDPSALHQAALTLTHDTVNKCAPLELAAIIGNAARLKEQAQTWCVCVELIGIHAHFSASLKLLESCYPVVRNAALHADLILAALYQSGSVVLPSQHEFEDCLDNVNAIFPILDDNLQALFMSAIKPVLIEGHIEFRHRDFALRSVIKSPTFVGFQSLGETGSEPSFELACHLANAARSQQSVIYCSNCRERPVAAHTRCFPDWCRRCDFSLWSTRPRNTSSCVDLDPSAAGSLPLPSNESVSEFQCRGFRHDHLFSIP